MKKHTSTGGGNWRGFFQMLRSICLPWPAILVAFVVELAYNHVLLSLPTTTAALMSGSLEDKALYDALLYYISYGVVVTLDFFILGYACRLSVRNARIQIWGGMTRIRMDYYDSHTPTALSSAITNDLEESVRLLVSLMISLIPNFYYLVSAIRTVSQYDFLLVLSILLPLPLRYIEMVVVGRWNYRTQSGIYARIGALTGYLAERVKNLSLIKYFGTEEKELKNGQNASEDLFKANFDAVKVEGAATAINQVISVLQQIIIVLFGVLLLQKGRINLQQWVAFFLFSSTISSRFITVVQNWQSLKSIQGQVARVVDIVDAPKEEAGACSTASQPLSPDIRFENISFAYGEKKALRQVSFTIPSGTSAAIVGPCGSGKTTLFNLLERFYEATDGRILLGGTDIKELPLSELRGKFSYVQQEAGVFSGTIREILTYGIRRELDDATIMQAAKSAGAWDFIEKLPGALNAAISADGQSLSGGQRQRLVLAREFLRDADVLLFDEPTSALDATTARAVQETIFRLFKGKTILMITHDLTLTENLDQILVLNGGELAGLGSRETLLKTCPLFAQMVAAQSGKEAPGI
ncbi:MAG: ABC transporter ATP-binding protein [Lachnospiraceae bacterium]|nr:ABC transporter ATP-binding protein [Lachnospiraceae bacterium]